MRFGSIVVTLVCLGVVGCGANAGDGTTTTCSAPSAACAGACVDLQSNALNCGACGRACASAESCMAGACRLACPDGQSACSGTCVDLRSNARNCSACGNACASGESCMAGACLAGCASPRRICGGVCTALDSDPANCGACGNGCAAASACRGGVCTSLGTPDAGLTDAGRSDTGSVGVDAGSPRPDSGPSITDSGTPAPDAGISPECGAMTLGSAVGATAATGTTTGRPSLHTPPSTCTNMPSAVSPDAVYTWTAPSAGAFTFDTVGSSFDTLLTIHDGACMGAVLGCNDDIVNGTNTASRLTLTLAAGQTVAIAIEGYGTNSGSYVLNISRGAADAGAPVDAGSAVDAGAVDPCGGVTTDGRCASATIIEYCSVSTGSGAPPSLQRFTCAPGERCFVDSGGAATCVAAGSCIPGASQCAGNSRQRCVGGTWSTTACAAQCVDSALGSFCAPTLPTTTATGTLVYVARGPNSTTRPTDWSTVPINARAQAFTIVSVRQNADGSQTYFDAVTSGGGAAAGQFSLRVPTPATSSDYLIALALSSDGAAGIRYMVANPQLSSPGTQEVGTIGSAPTAWGWTFRLNTFINGSTLTITESMGSGAARLFDYMRYIYGNVSESLLSDGLHVVAWMQPGTSWSCGACFTQRPTDLFGSATASGVHFDAQIWYNGSASDQEYWSDAVTAHELGHWVMASYSTSPGEGGPHYTGSHVYPGMAWSEGWATYFSSRSRTSSVYYDKQGGTFFWFDIGARAYSGPLWLHPLAAAGLEQTIDENEVAAMTWSLHNSSASAPGQILLALASPHMNGTTFDRGYRAWQWNTTDSAHNPYAAVHTSRPAPYFADFLDALVCNGFSTAAVDAATLPSIYYPYPSASPLCF